MNPNIRSGAKGNRNFGLHTGPGKGDADRTTDATAYQANLTEVNFPRVPASQDPTFTKTKRGYTKSYGPTQPLHNSAEVVPPSTGAT